MSVVVEKINRGEVLDLISQVEDVSLTEGDKEKFRQSLVLTTTVWAGVADGKLVCVWGLVPPTLLSDSAYLWLYTTEAIKGHVFLFIRHSQIAIKAMLELYPTITGVTRIGNARSLRWLKWLGAEFGEPNGLLLPFVIRNK